MNAAVAEMPAAKAALSRLGGIVECSDPTEREERAGALLHNAFGSRELLEALPAAVYTTDA